MSALAHLFMLNRNRLASKVWEVSLLKGDHTMRETNDPNADLDDLLFDPDDGGPSQR